MTVLIFGIGCRKDYTDVANFYNTMSMLDSTLTETIKAAESSKKVIAEINAYSVKFKVVTHQYKKIQEKMNAGNFKYLEDMPKDLKQAVTNRSMTANRLMKTIEEVRLKYKSEPDVAESIQNLIRLLTDSKN